MDINDIRSITTVMAFIAFIGVWVWAWSSKRKTAFNDAANQLFNDEEERIHQKSVAETNQ
jgi:cytochrome c oxidase cbb3-type subunit 4